MNDIYLMRSKNDRLMGFVNSYKEAEYISFRKGYSIQKIKRLNLNLLYSIALAF